MTPARMSIGDLASAGVLEFGDGYRTKRSEHGRPGYRIIRVADVLDDVVKLDGPDFVFEEYAGKIGAKIGQPGDILLTTKGTVGRVAVMPSSDDPVVYSPQLCFFRVIENDILNPRFLRYWFSSQEFWEQASYRMNNTDMAAYINMADIRSMKISLPSTVDQQAIVEVLGALDDKIAANTKLAQTSRELAGAEFTRLVKTPGTSATLRDVLRLEYGKSLAAKKRVEGDVDVFGSGGIVGKHNEPLFTGPGVIVGRKGTAGSVHWAPRAYFPIDTTFYVVPTDSDISLIFCFHLLKSLPLSEMNSDSAVPGLNREEALSTPIRVPKKSEIQRFSALADHLFSVAQQSEQESKTLASMRDALLPQLMAGKLRVQDAEKTVEETL